MTMSYPQSEIDELKVIAPNLSIAQEGGYSYLLIEKLQLPEGCQPNVVDALLCPTPHSQYQSRLFFSQKITGCPPRNWNGSLRVLGKNWSAISWQIPAGLRLAEILLLHLKPLRNS